MRRLVVVLMLLGVWAAEGEGAVISVSPQWTFDGAEQNAEFGFSVATAGDINQDGYSDVIVGAPAYDGGIAGQGRAFLFVGTDTGLMDVPAWITQAQIAGAAHGWSVATAGDVNRDGYSDVIVGQPLWTNGQFEEGRVVVYHGTGNGLEFAHSWEFEGDLAGARLGTSVATAGDVNRDGFSDVIVGAPLYLSLGGLGAVFVFTGSVGGLSGAPYWTKESTVTNENMGASVSTAGDVNGDGYFDVVVGAPFYSNDQISEGRVQVFFGSLGGPDATSPWVVEGDWDMAHFGYSVATAGDVNGDGYADIIVGAPRYGSGQASEGKIHVFHGSDTVPSLGFVRESDLQFAQLGYSVSTAGDVNGDGYADVIVGAPGYGNVETNEGLAVVYLGSSSGLESAAAWRAEMDEESAFFGTSVSLAGDVNGDGFSDVIVGANDYTGIYTQQGRAYAFHGSAEGLAWSEAWTAEGNQTWAHFGIAVSPAGDVNGDGFSDVIVGAEWYSNGETDEGGAFVYHGSPIGLGFTADWSVESNQQAAEMGHSVATAGDVNNDGYSDVIVGASEYDTPAPEGGCAFVYMGSESGLEATPSWTAQSFQDADRLGSSVNTAGDVNGDGFSDVIVGVRGLDNGENNEGGAYVFHGSGSGLSFSPDWIGESNDVDSLYGDVVASIGDVDADGYSDVVVGARLSDQFGLDQGAVFVYHGSPNGLLTISHWIAGSDQSGSSFGGSAASAGDVNGDGYSDLIVGEHLFTNGQTAEGRVTIYHGAEFGLGPAIGRYLESDSAFSHFGYSVAGAGDVNGDGYSDVIVGARGFANNESSEGAIFVYHGSPTGIPATADWSVESNVPDAALGVAVATAGDVNGDGYSDVIAGAWGYTNGESNEGRAYVYYGNMGRGLTVTPGQASPAAEPVQLLGSVRHETIAQLKMRNQTPAGRTLARLLGEAKPVGTLFDNTLTFDFLNLVDTGLAGADHIVSHSGLAPATAYHWRLRLQYLPYMNYSRWASIGPNGANETDFRTAGDCVLTGQPETLCNGVDDDCDSQTDEDYVIDASCGESHCQQTNTPSSCNGGIEIDCQPGVPQDESQASDTCDDMIDNDCDGASDFSDPDCQASCIDRDGDGYGLHGDPSCPEQGVDCLDYDANVHPGADELDYSCDMLDNDCNGQIDEGVCDDGNECTLDACDAPSGGCRNPPKVCEGEDPCAEYYCDPDIGCVDVDICPGCYRCAEGDYTGTRCEKIGRMPCAEPLCEFTEAVCDPEDGQCVIEGYCDKQVPGCDRPVVVYGRDTTLQCRFEFPKAGVRIEVGPEKSLPGGFVPVSVWIENLPEYAELPWTKPLQGLEFLLELDPGQAAYVDGSARLQGGTIGLSEEEPLAADAIEVKFWPDDPEEELEAGGTWKLDFLMYRGVGADGEFKISVWAPCDADLDQVGCHDRNNPDEDQGRTEIQRISSRVVAILAAGSYSGETLPEKLRLPASGCQCGSGPAGSFGNAGVLVLLLMLLGRAGRRAW